MDLLKRTIALFNIRHDGVYKTKHKKNEGTNAVVKTKSQLDFENGIDDKPVITDMAYAQQGYF